jgi:DNA-binding GntR family transcriptional regulator
VPTSSPAAHNKSPLYHSIAGVLRSLIASGELNVGAQLPTIAALAQRYQVAPVTVREAFRLLTQEGLIRARRGSGTFVNEAPLRLTSPVTEAG